MRVFHIATASDWEEAQSRGSYTTSTYGRTLEEVGFIHAARHDQWGLVKRKYFAEVYEPLVLLEIETDRLGSVVVLDEQPYPGAEVTYPHIYGPVPADAVVRVRDVSRSTEE